MAANGLPHTRRITTVYQPLYLPEKEFIRLNAPEISLAKVIKWSNTLCSFLAGSRFLKQLKSVGGIGGVQPRHDIILVRLVTRSALAYYSLNSLQTHDTHAQEKPRTILLYGNEQKTLLMTHNDVNSCLQI